MTDPINSFRQLLPENSLENLVKNDHFRTGIEPLLKEIKDYNHLSPASKFLRNLFDGIRDFFSSFLSFVRPSLKTRVATVLNNSRIFEQSNLVKNASIAIFLGPDQVESKIASYKSSIREKLKENILGLQQASQGSLEEGIFRVADDSNPIHQSAGFIKKCVNEINYFEPIEEDLARFIKEHQGAYVDRDDDSIDEFLTRIDESNKKSFFELFQLLNTIAKDKTCKMDAKNLAIVFAPNFFPKTTDFSQLSKQITFLEHMINNYEKLTFKLLISAWDDA